MKSNENADDAQARDQAIATEASETEENSAARLTVVELDGAFMVVSEDDPSDWLACFSHDERFPARDWAERMAELYNLRDPDAERDPSSAPIFWGTHHPSKPDLQKADSTS